MSPSWRQRAADDGAGALEALRWVRARIDREQVQAARYLALLLHGARPGGPSVAAEREPERSSIGRPVRPGS